MSDLYLKVKDVQLVETRDLDAFSSEAKTAKHWLIKTDFSNSDISVKVNPNKPKVEVLILDEHDESIKKLLLTILKMSYVDLESAFGARDLDSILRAHTISEIRERYEAWKNRPKIGDEVKYGVHTGVVISYTKEKDYVRVLANGENSIFCFPPDGVKKTGRHFDNVSIGDLGKYAEVAR